MKNLIFLAISCFLLSCSKSYYIYNSNEEVPIYSDKLTYDSVICIVPVGAPILIEKSKEIKAAAQYRNYSGWAYTRNLLYVRHITKRQYIRYYADSTSNRTHASKNPGSSSTGTVNVKGHYRRTKSGKSVYVKPHTRSKPKKY